MQKKLIIIFSFFIILSFFINYKKRSMQIADYKVVDIANNQQLEFDNYDQVKYKYIPSFSTHKTSDEISSLVWHRWTLGKTFIHSVEKDQGEHVYENIKKITVDFNNYLDLENKSNQEVEVKIFCLPSADLMQTLFNLNKSAVQYSGETKSIYAWLILDDSNIDLTLRSVVSSIELQKLEIENPNINMNFWSQRGLITIFKDEESTKEKLKNANLSSISFEEFVSTDKSTYLTFDEQKKSNYDAKSVFLCLMIKKEFGKSKLKTCIGAGKDFFTVLNFKDLNQFEEKYNLYCEYLQKDIISNKTPDSYLK